MKKVFSGGTLTLIFVAAVVIGVAVAVHSCVAREKPDLTLTYVGENYFDSDLFYSSANLLSDGLDDVNADGKKTADLVTISFGANLTQGQEQNNISRLTMSIGAGESRVYLMDKAYCLRYADSEFLADVSPFAGDREVLVNDAGKVYAVSVEGNTLLESLGLDDTENVYLTLRAVTEIDGVSFDNIGAIDACAKKLYRYIINNNIN